jgi:RNA polymerase sigma-70 factor (ECF subfamily)
MSEDAESTVRFDHHRERVRRFLVGRVHDHHVAEDLTQETLLRAVLYADGLREPNAAGAWLLRIAWHVVLDFHRRRARRRDEPTADGTLEPVEELREPTALEALEERAAFEQSRRRLRAALAQLGPLDRVLVIGHYFVGLTCAELAVRARITRDNVKVRLMRARRRLRALLPPPQEDELRRTARGPRRVAGLRVVERRPPLAAAG